MARVMTDVAESPVRQAGGVVFRTEGGQTEFLVITTKDHRSWIFPKGHVEEGEGDVDAALREVQEESGVCGAAVATLDPPHRFRSAGEDIVVRYILVRALSDGEPEAGRDKRWVTAEDALVLLTQPDARQLLLRALKLTDGRDRLGAPERFVDLVLADHQHLSRCLGRAEGIAEQRVTALIALLVGGGIAASFGPPLATAALGVALLAGLLTLRRVVRDAEARDGYERGLARLRRTFVPTEGDPRRSLLAVDPYAEPGRHRWPRAVPTAILVNAVLAGGLAASAVPGPAVFVGVAVVAGVVLVMGVLRYSVPPPTT